MLEREEEEELAREAATDRATENVAPSPQTVPKHPPPPRTLDQVVHPRADASRPSPLIPAQASTNISIPSDHAAKATPGPSITADTGTLNIGVARKPKKQKSVSFVDPVPPDHSNDRSHMADLDIDWGDVVPMRLNSRSTRKPGPNVMKDLVVEHPPGQPRVPFNRMEDSDDEDEAIEDEDDMSQADASDTEVPAEALRPSRGSDDESDDEEAEVAVDADETDFDEAMLQREIALAYYARRNQIGSDITSGPLSGSTVINQKSSDDGSGDVMPDVNESNTSRFRQSRLNEDPQTLINSAIQFGKLVDGQLVVGEVADQEVQASLDELTSGGGNNNTEDLTEKTLALLKGETHTPQGESVRSSTHNGHARPPVRATASMSTSLGNIVAPQPNIAPEPNLKSKQTTPTTSSKQKSSQQPNPALAATARAPPPMIIESGFGFDPAFQVAPKPQAAAAEPIAPMSETVKERSSTPITNATDRDRGKSRFAQASRTGGVKPRLSSATPNPETPSTALQSDVIERAVPPSRVQPPEPKRISRFRAERAGYL
ncbi:hypothetical protein FRC08_012137 [Ceratobasidium sp. 394]|nr:hypothetical protein FRC08_012137 [Ceratobasidium sp. 394]